MGENLAVDERLAVRTPMQWTAGPTAGLLDGAARRACAARCRPTSGSRRDAVNVQAQRTDPDSLLNWFERLIRLRKELPEIGWGDVHRARRRRRPRCSLCATSGADRVLVTVHNLAGRAVTADLDAGKVGTGLELVDLLQAGDSTRPRQGRFRVPLRAYDQRWFTAAAGAARR